MVGNWLQGDESNVGRAVYETALNPVLPAKKSPRCCEHGGRDMTWMRQFPAWEPKFSNRASGTRNPTYPNNYSSIFTESRDIFRGQEQKHPALGVIAEEGAGVV